MAAVAGGGGERAHEQELRAAHARIRELEGRIAGNTPAIPFSWRRLLARAAFALTLLLIAIAMAWAIFPRRAVVVQGAGTAPAPAIPVGALTWRAGAIFREHGPLLVDLDGDGALDIIGLAWRHGQDAAPLHVVAFDRKTYAVIWRAGPFRAKWRDEAVRVSATATEIIVADGVGTSHVLDRRTGAELTTIGTPSELPDPRERRCPVDGTLPCTADTPPAIALKVDALLRGHGYSYDLVDGAARVTLSSVAGPQAQREGRALRWDADGKKLLFDVPLIPPPSNDKRASSSPNEWTALGHGRLLHLYQHPSGDYHLATRDAKTGVLAYDVPVPALHDGSVVGAVMADGDDVFVVADESLVVIDARTGAVSRRLQRF